MWTNTIRNLIISFYFFIKNIILAKYLDLLQNKLLKLLENISQNKFNFSIEWMAFVCFNC